MTDVNPFFAGLRGRCPRCGEGPLFDGFLEIADECEACGLDFSREDAGDGPAVFIMFLVGFIVVPLALALELAVAPPIWVHLLLWLPLATALCLLFLRPFKATLFALQYKHDAEEARLDEDPDR
ncbi:hypothetical protein DDZ18_08335 [Marinicauda salina]|uniref:DUF983 domain-containing protein n=1 Tax=Marinicauda salina TaxID=2135793 RepID=A0A2U2BUE4_9PROT|nr:DUF983 domain-containing protein [Marinicauda salina]PWE17656.1 hypothetical protein DDZ18_08335 [Marinicauda salina]